MKIITLLGLFLFSLSGNAATNSKFDYLIGKIVESEHRAELGVGQGRWLQHFNPEDLDKQHQADYITLLGSVSFGEFQAYDMSLVSEDWSFNAEGNWVIDQWILKINMANGELIGIQHYQLIETLDRTVLDSIALDTKGPTDPESIALWNKLRENWYSWVAN